MFFAMAALLPVSALFAQVAAPPPGADFSYAPVSPGTWAYRPAAGASDAYFMDSGGTIRLALRCTRQVRQITLSRISAAPAATLTVWTTSMQRTVPARFDRNAARVSAELAAADRLLDAIAFSRGRIAVSMPGSPPLVVASAPEAARVIEDCRN